MDDDANADADEVLVGEVMSPCTLFVFFPLPYRFVMSLHTCIGMGYRHSMLDASLWSMDASTIVTRLTSRSVMGHALPIQVHQHYGLVFRFALTENSCIRRGCHSSEATRRICTQLERQRLPLGVCVRASLTSTACCLCRTKSNSVLELTHYQACVSQSVTATVVRLISY